MFLMAPPIFTTWQALSYDNKQSLQSSWDQSGSILCKDVRVASKNGVSGNVSVCTFLVELLKKLSRDVNSKLASIIVSSISHDYNNDYILDGDLYQQNVPEICRTLRDNSHPALEMVREGLVKRVRERMVQRKDENCRPSCDIRCPLCGIMCFHSTKHTRRHTMPYTNPGGLAGGPHFACSHKLVAQTSLVLWMPKTAPSNTSAKVSMCHIAISRRYIPHGWSLNLSKNERIARKVRECIFFNY